MESQPHLTTIDGESFKYTKPALIHKSIRRKHRRLANIWLHKPAVVRYTSILDHEATVMVQSLHHYGQGGALPINPQPHAFRCTLNDMLRVTFGIRTDTINDPLVARALWLSREFM